MENCLSDILCWMSGFNAGSDVEYPFKLYDIRVLNDKLKHKVYERCDD